MEWLFTIGVIVLLVMGFVVLLAVEFFSTADEIDRNRGE